MPNYKVQISVNLLQVVTLSVYTYFIAALIGRQFILSDTDMFFPFFTVLQVRSTRSCIYFAV